MNQEFSQVDNPEQASQFLHEAIGQLDARIDFEEEQEENNQQLGDFNVLIRHANDYSFSDHQESSYSSLQSDISMIQKNQSHQPALNEEFEDALQILEEREERARQIASFEPDRSVQYTLALFRGYLVRNMLKSHRKRTECIEKLRNQFLQNSQISQRDCLSFFNNMKGILMVSEIEQMKGSNLFSRYNAEYFCKFLQIDLKIVYVHRLFVENRNMIMASYDIAHTVLYNEFTRVTSCEQKLEGILCIFHQIQQIIRIEPSERLQFLRKYNPLQ